MHTYIHLYHIRQYIHACIKAGSSKETIDAIRTELQSGAMEDYSIEIDVPARTSTPEKVVVIVYACIVLYVCCMYVLCQLDLQFKCMYVYMYVCPPRSLKISN